MWTPTWARPRRWHRERTTRWPGIAYVDWGTSEHVPVPHFWTGDPHGKNGVLSRTPVPLRLCGRRARMWEWNFGHAWWICHVDSSVKYSYCWFILIKAPAVFSGSNPSVRPLGKQCGPKVCFSLRTWEHKLQQGHKQESFDIASTRDEEQGEGWLHSCHWAWCSHVSLCLFNGL